ncbi:hypothetical protein MO867_14345 [Microbulbifer sp. OS29]|uniref:DUF4157 domain-containing protein n=1 Tax=Microbulbifer okhotskensis TaxID=2926617 RepID=A0A9X2EPM9_9GAMM|nr:hypothetical protein [Microbulbifer okhotskensis]MCO1335516.1 hypothetical protein [Microbulbifer okhotskensis]
MLPKIERWIDQTILDFKDKRHSCDQFSSEFDGYYTKDFLFKSHFVVVDEIPKPTFPELYQAGLGDFVDMEVAGITYKDTYFVMAPYAMDLSLHFHELVHVHQWALLGPEVFIQRYITEIQTYGYNSAPLEVMAYSLQDQFMERTSPIDVSKYVQGEIEEAYRL